MGSNYIFELSDKVNRKEVAYPTRYGNTLIGDLYTSKDLDESKKNPAIIIGPPYGGVKEQGPGVYANQLAQRGFVVLAFDQVNMGESSGFPRHVSSPGLFTESFMAGVDFLGTKLDYVDKDKIAAIGICGSGGFLLNAAAVDARIKAVVTVSMYDMTQSVRDGLTDNGLEKLAEQRWIDAENGYPQYIPSWPDHPVDKVPEGLDPITEEFFTFYATKRGFHPNARSGFTTTSDISMLQFKLEDFIDQISPRQVLFVMGDKAHSRYFSEEAYANAKQPKELYIVEDAIHIDLYDRLDRIPFDKIEEFLKESLKV